MVVGAGLWVLHRYDPSQTPLYPRCQFYEMTGWLCPGCGSQRALHALTHLELLPALRCNALLVLGGPLLVAGWAWRKWHRRKTPPALYGRTEKQWFYLLAGTAIIFSVLRNLPWPPFSWLAP